MPRISQIPLNKFDAHSRGVIERQQALGLLEHPQYAQTIAHSQRLLGQLVRALPAGPYGGAEDILGRPLCELLRIRSAQIAGCAPCAQARYVDELSEETISCVAIDASALSPREQLALEFLGKMHTDHHSIDDAFFGRLVKQFNTAEIVELGAYVSGMLGGHRFLHVLDILGGQEPIAS